jgi:outer membrane protein assembly factor BamB
VKLENASTMPRSSSLVRWFAMAVSSGSLAMAILVDPRGLMADNWPRWRGPESNGVSRETGLTVAWSEGQGVGVVWKCPLPEWGNSTPVVWNDAIFLTSQTDDGQLLLVKISKASGKIQWTRQVGSGKTEVVKQLRKTGEARRHQKFPEVQNYASPSCATDGEVVVAHFGNGDLAVYDFDGNQLWHRNLQKDYGEYTIWWGHANSPELYQDLVISICLQDSCADLPGVPSPSYVVAHDKRTGKERWKVLRKTEAQAESCDAYITPLLWNRGKHTELVVMGGLLLDAYDPRTGMRLWYLPGLVGNRVITGPMAAGELLFVTQGMRQALLAIKPCGDGQRTREDIVWKLDQGTPDSPTPTVWGDLLFLVSDNGVARCLDTASGRLLWKERLKGDYRASPLAAEGRVYFLNMKGLTTVVAATPRFNRLTENQLDDATVASPVTSDGRIFIRGHKWLYCIAK